jgi:hypothetical protein
MIWIPFSLAAVFFLCVLVLMNAEVWQIGLYLFCVAMLLVAWMYREPLRRWLVVKLTEWRNDAKQLGLWIRLAFTRKRSTLETATMTHQMQFLQGRIMSPMNLFTVAVVAVLLVPLVFFAQEWRIGRIKAEARRECSDHELTRNPNGRYRTDRQACADLGAQREAAAEWRTRAIEAEARAIRDIARIREEDRLARVAEQQRRVRSAALTERVRRRQDETITAALGGPSPDLERSLCELAGDGQCAPAEPASGNPVPAAPLDLHAGSGDDPISTAPDAPR